MINLNKLLNIIFVAVIVGLSRELIQLKKQISTDAAKRETEELAKDQNRIDNWITYNNDQYQFSFKHPSLSDTCCTMGGPATGEAIFNLTLADLDTVTVEYSNEPFAGVSVYVVKTDLPFTDYISGEKEALLNQDREFSQSEYSNQVFIDDGVEEQVLVNGQSGVSLTNFSWDGIKRYYLPLPNSTDILTINQSSAASSKFTFEEILSTFRLGRQP